jgi:hypothetical protein
MDTEDPQLPLTPPNIFTSISFPLTHSNAASTHKRFSTLSVWKSHRQNDLNMARQVKMGRHGPTWAGGRQNGLAWARVGVTVTYDAPPQCG